MYVDKWLWWIHEQRILIDHASFPDRTLAPQPGLEPTGGSTGAGSGSQMSILLRAVVAHGDASLPSHLSVLLSG
jgi:hypothetical protein